MLLQAVNFTGYRLIRRTLNLSVFSLAETISSKILSKPLPKIEKRPLLLDVHTCIAKKLPPVKPE